MRGKAGYKKLGNSEGTENRSQASSSNPSNIPGESSYARPALASPVDDDEEPTESHPLQSVIDIQVAGEDSEDEDPEDNRPLAETLAQAAGSNAPPTGVRAITAASSSAAAGPHPTAGTQANDGVFFNISAKPDLYADKPPNEPLPSYQEVVGEQAPPYFDPTVVAIGTDTGEILIEGLPVGNLFVFALNMLVSTVFQLVGFLLTYLLHSSHAAKDGSFVGLGITFLHFGFYIRSRIAHPNQYGNDGHPSSQTGITNGMHNVYLSYILMVIGWFIVLRSVADYIRVKRLQLAIMSSPEGVV